MEYIEGRTLTDLVTRAFEVSHPLPISYAAHILGQVAEGLAYLQDGLARRPLPPGRRGSSTATSRRPTSSSSYAGHTKIIDFGIARAGTSVTVESGARPGKLSYMSPEQAQGLPLDGRSDIFSLGTILYEITLGRRLWRGPPETVHPSDRPGGPRAAHLREPRLPADARADRAARPGQAARRSLCTAPVRWPATSIVSWANVASGWPIGTSRSSSRGSTCRTARVNDGGSQRARDFRDEDEALDELDQPLNFDGCAARARAVAHALRDSNVFDLAARAVSAPRQGGVSLGDAVRWALRRRGAPSRRPQPP